MSYDDYEDIEFSDDEVCGICGTPFYYVERSGDGDICTECDPGEDYDYTEAH